MSHIEIRNTLNSTLETAVSVPISYENKEFSPNNLDAFVASYYMPSTSESMGKTLESSDDERGFYQVSIFIKLAADDFDNQQLSIADGIKSIFKSGSTFDSVYIESVDLTPASVENGWFKRDLTINFSSYQSK